MNGEEEAPYFVPPPTGVACSEDGCTRLSVGRVAREYHCWLVQQCGSQRAGRSRQAVQRADGERASGGTAGSSSSAASRCGQRQENTFHGTLLDEPAVAPVRDCSEGQHMGWQVIRFSSRPVRAVKITGLYNSASQCFVVVEFEAYCVPPAQPPR